MAVEGSYLGDTYVAGADLSALQFTFVKFNSSGQVVAVAAATDVPCGVLQNKPKSGQMAEVRWIGRTKLKFGGSINPGVQIGTTSGGLAVTVAPGTDTTKFILGQVSSNPGGAYTGDAVINCINPARAA